MCSRASLLLWEQKMTIAKNLPLVAMVMLLACPARAQGQAQPAEPEVRQSVPGGQSDVTEADKGGVWRRASLFATWGGLRPALEQRGITFGVQEASEVLGNVTGGTRRAIIYEGLTQLSLGLDTAAAFGWAGGTFNISALQIHGRGLSLNALGNNLHTVSSLEAERGTLLFELWYEQAFGKTVSVRVGQLAADQEFMVSAYAALFTNHTFGWSTHPSIDLPSGGPSYPLATPGVRLRVTPSDNLTVLAAVFNGDPAGAGDGTPQQRNPSGTAFRLGDGVLAIAEVQYGVGGDGETSLPGTYKIGGWYNSQPFADQRRNAAGLSLADPGDDPVGRRHRGNYGIYATMDQLVWRRAGTKDGGIGVFARAMGSPGDRNLVNAYLDAGITWKGLWPGRDSDTAGLAVGYARISDAADKLDSDMAGLDGRTPVRRHETVLEATYQYQVAPWLQVQPSIQYVFNLNGGVLNPRDPSKRLGDALVLGMRTNVTF